MCAKCAKVPFGEGGEQGEEPPLDVQEAEEEGKDS